MVDWLELLWQAIIWFLARWSSTYLIPSNEIDKGIRSQNVSESNLQTKQAGLVFLGLFGEHNQGKHILDIVVRIAMTTLVSYPGEKDLQVRSKQNSCYSSVFPHVFFALLSCLRLQFLFNTPHPKFYKYNWCLKKIQILKRKQCTFIMFVQKDICCILVKLVGKCFGCNHNLDQFIWFDSSNC